MHIQLFTDEKPGWMTTRYTIEIITNRSLDNRPRSGQWEACDQWLDYERYQVINPTVAELAKLQDLSNCCTTDSAIKIARQGMTPEQIVETDRLIENGEWCKCTFLNGFREARIEKQPADYDFQYKVVTVEEAIQLLRTIVIDQAIEQLQPSTT